MFCICVLSAHLGNFKHIDSQTPDTAGCHVWRACAWRLTAQGYLKGCANFALFTAPINSVCFGGSLCEVWMLDAAIDGQHVALRCLCFCVVHFNRLRWCALSPVTFCLTSAWLPRGSHVTVLNHDDQGEENAGGSNLQGGPDSGR